MEALIWFVAGLIFAGLELLGGEFSLLLLGGAALGTAGISLTGVPLWAQVVFFAVSSFALLVFVRPILHRHLHKDPILDTSPKALEGKPAEVIEPVSATGGLVRIDGDFWSAKSMLSHETYSENDRVLVARIEGSTAIVWKEA
ncbi:NfeD family protein [Staphylococcus chromogenes]|nr:NfeD family protein [Staphylococcus chromogenes]